MNVIIWTIIWVLVGALSIGLLIFVIWKMLKWKNNKRAKIISDLGKRAQSDNITKIDSILMRVNLISENNDKYLFLANRLGVQFDEIDLGIKAIYNLIEHLSVNYKKMKKDEFELHTKKANDSIISVERMVIKFESEAEGITQQDSFMRSELSFFQKHLREIIVIYKNKRVFLK